MKKTVTLEFNNGKTYSLEWVHGSTKHLTEIYKDGLIKGSVVAEFMRCLVIFFYKVSLLGEGEDFKEVYQSLTKINNVEIDHSKDLFPQAKDCWMYGISVKNLDVANALLNLVLQDNIIQEDVSIMGEQGTETN